MPDTTIELNSQALDALTEDDNPVALYLRQKLLPVEAGDPIIFPPTYADIGYSIDKFPDGTSVAQIDSVGSQANRLEPLFKDPPLSVLVPQLLIEIGKPKGGESHVSISIFDIGHRIADALVRTSNAYDLVKTAFASFTNSGDATPLAKLAPTAIVFGAWDSRDGGAKLPRLLQSIIRAWDVEEVHRAAQYNPPVNYSDFDVFDEAVKQEAEQTGGKDPIAQRGFVHVPAVWRIANKERVLGGVLVRGAIWREMTINLVALRRLRAASDTAKGTALRRYVLGLALAVATAPLDGYLRQGCLLTTDPAQAAYWELVARNGARTQVEISRERALAYATEAARVFGVGPSQSFAFSKASAKLEVDELRKKIKKQAKAKGAAAGSLPDDSE